MHEFLSRPRFWLDHRWAPDHMSEYLDGDLASSGRERMARHVGECRDCRIVLGELRLMIERLGRLPSPEGGAAVRITTAVRVRLREPPRS